MEAVSKFRQWYDKNKQTLNAKRKEKYLTDPAYREQCLTRKRAQTEKKAQQSQYKTTISGQIVRAYQIGEASDQIGKRPSTLRQWEATGLIPPSIFPTQRLYTPQQIDLMRGIAVMLALSGARHTDHAKVQAVLQAHKIKIYEQWNDVEAEK